MTEPHPIADVPTAPIEVPLTHEFVGDYVRREVAAATTQVSPHDLASALEDIAQLKRTTAEAERRAAEAVSPLLTWAKRNQKLLLWLVLGGGGSSGAYATIRGQLQESAEEAVLERQAEEAQVEAVKANSAASIDNAEATHDLADRVDDLDTKVGQNAELMRTAIEVQLAQPGAKKRIRADPALKAKTEAAVGPLDD